MIKILNQFVCKEGILRNIEYISKPFETETPDTIWQWMPYGYNNIKLTYENSVDNTVKFIEGVLEYDTIGCKFTYFGKEFEMKRTK